MVTKVQTVLAAFLAAALLAPLATAHVDVMVHERFPLKLGWVSEPPVVDGPNGIYLRIGDLGAKAHDDGHGHGSSTSGDAHGHGDETTHSNMSGDMHSNETGHGMDVDAHGAIFQSDQLDTGQSFEFTPTPMHAGLAIPFHDHFNHDATGTLTVDANATGNASVVIELKNDGYHPHMVTVAPGTLVRFTNAKMAMGDAVTLGQVVSGRLSSGGHDHGEEAPHAHGMPYAGAEKTLQVEVTLGAKSKVFPLVAKTDEAGSYIAPFVPTVAGVYSVRVFGTLDGIDVNVTKDIERVTATTAEKWPETGPSTFEAAQELAKQASEIQRLKDDIEAKRKEAPGVGLVAALAVVGLAALLYARRR